METTRRKRGPSTFLIYLHFLEITPENLGRLHKLKSSNDKLLIEETLEQRLPTNGLIRLLEKTPTKRLFELKQASHAFPLLCQKLGSNKATTYVFRQKITLAAQPRFAVQLCFGFNRVNPGILC